jgi:hypothetical protein
VESNDRLTAFARSFTHIPTEAMEDQNNGSDRIPVA